MSASAAPASRNTEGCMPLPTTPRKSSRSSSMRRRAGFWSMMVMSFCSGSQILGHAFTHAASSQNDDVHALMFPTKRNAAPAKQGPGGLRLPDLQPATPSQCALDDDFLHVGGAFVDLARARRGRCAPREVAHVAVAAQRLDGGAARTPRRFRWQTTAIAASFRQGRPASLGRRHAR